MQPRSPKTFYRVVLEFKNGMTRTVKIKAASREAAEKRALKFHPHGSIKRNAL